MADNVSDFKELVRDIESKKILLPDFQRDFVWKDEEKQEENSSICFDKDADRKYSAFDFKSR